MAGRKDAIVDERVAGPRAGDRGSPYPAPAFIAGVAALLLAGLAAWWWSLGSPELPLSELPVTPVVADAAAPGLTVHVSGQVVAAGLVEVASDGRVADAIAAAGGVLAEADLTAINLAARVRDGERIVVPPVSGSGADATMADDGRIRVNVADAEAMEALPGVGPVLAERIVSHREHAGLFSTAEDLLDVPGIGELKLAAIRDVIVVP